MSETRSWRIVYSEPGALGLCGCCDRPIEAFTEPLALPGCFHDPGKMALLCHPCAKVWFEQEDEAERQAEAWYDAGCPGDA